MNEDLLELEMLKVAVDYQEASDSMEDIIHESLYEETYDGIDWGDDNDII